MLRTNRQTDEQNSKILFTPTDKVGVGNKCVFNSLRKLSLLTSGVPYRGGTRSRRMADLRCCREATSETGRQRSTKYCGAWPCRQLCAVMQSLYVTRSGTLSQPVQLDMHYSRQALVIKLVCAGDNTSRSIHYSLKLVSRHFRCTR